MATLQCHRKMRLAASLSASFRDVAWLRGGGGGSSSSSSTCTRGRRYASIYPLNLAYPIPSPRSSASSSPAAVLKEGRPRWINDKGIEVKKSSGGQGDEGGDPASTPTVEQDDSIRRPEKEPKEVEKKIDESSSPTVVKRGGRHDSTASAEATSGGGTAAAGGASGDGSGKKSSSAPPSSPPSNPNAGLNALTPARQSVPETYPRLLALPITRRPLFPGFYKAVVIRNPHVVRAVKEMMRRGQPYLGAFLLKDEEADSDIIESKDDVHDVGVFAQITSVFPASAGTNPTSRKEGKEAGETADDKEGSLTAVLYPHRRIKMVDLISPGADKEARSAAVAKIVHMTEHHLAEAHDQVDKSGESTSSDGTVARADGKDGSATSAIAQTAFLDDYAVSMVNVQNLYDSPYPKKGNSYIRAVTSEIVSVFKDISALNSLFRDQVTSFSVAQSATNVFEEPAKLADFAAAVSAGEVGELQEVLESLVIEERLQKSLLLLKKELLNAQLQQKLSRDVETKIQKRQREYYLLEQLKGIKKELGLESDGKDKLVEKFKERANSLAMPEGVKKVFDEEINKLSSLEPAASEFNVTRNYLDWLTQIPWGMRSEENYDIKHATVVLDEDHHGLKDVKDRILEFIAVGKLRGTVEGKILCLVGPPGVGKTSIGKSIARALDRQFYRFSVGGLADVAEIKGHRRTYVGAMPGKAVQALKKVQTENPLILIDEVDKLGRGHQGDPASALLEMLDPEQNSQFLDHYMDVSIDLSKVLFVCTANSLDTIPGPLLDRMEVIELSGYVADEKLAIGRNFLQKNIKQLSGLEDAEVNITDDAMSSLISRYNREAGVRGLRKNIERIYRKIALKVIKDLALDDQTIIKASEGQQSISMGTDFVSTADAVADEQDPLAASTKAGGESEVKEGEVEKSRGTGSGGKEAPAHDETRPTTSSEPKPFKIPSTVQISVTPDNLKDYVGPPIFQSDRLYDVLQPGTVLGLAWTSMGGQSLPMEAILATGLTSGVIPPSVRMSGHMGDVMRESCELAYTYAKSFLYKHMPQNRFFNRAAIHLHSPEGAVPKDGPSAGITMTTALLSLALDHALPPTIAMTGELTLTGRVLRIGGLREKCVAAKRSGIKTVLFPMDNISDWEELPNNIREGLHGIPVLWYEDVYKIVFLEQGLDTIKAANRWEEEISAAERRERENRGGGMPTSQFVLPTPNINHSHHQDDSIRASR